VNLLRNVKALLRFALTTKIITPDPEAQATQRRLAA
jgi:hypothetical protein